MARAKQAFSSPVLAGAQPLKIQIDTAKYMGHEHIFDAADVNEDNRSSLMARAFNWYNYSFGSKDALSFMMDYLKYTKRADEAKLIKKAKDHTFPNAIGWLTRMYFMGWIFDESEHARIEAAIEKAKVSAISNMDIQSDDDTDVKAKKKFNIQEVMREKCAEAGGELEGMLDDYINSGAKAKHNFTPISVLKVANILPAHVNEEIKHWERIKVEYALAHSGKDKELTEAYGHFTKIQLRNLVKFCDLVIADHHGYVAFKKANKKVRKRKVKSPIELARKLKFLAEDKGLGLTSEKPSKIVGAKELFVFDVKKRKLMYFVADSYSGTLTIKNNTIDGFDASKSVQKTIRKPQDFMKEFMKASKPNTRKLFEKNKSVETKMSGRFNENIIILKVY